MDKKTQIEELYIDALNNNEAPNVFADQILFLFGVGKCSAKKDVNIERTILLVSIKDGLTDVYDDDGCLGMGLDTQGINDLNLS
jgi:hypothetical protein